MAISYIAQVSTTVDVWIFAAIKFVELMPANEVPVAIPVVGHQFATTATTNFPKEVAHAVVVSWVGLWVEIHSRNICTSKQLIDSVVEVGLCKRTEFCLCFCIVQICKQECNFLKCMVLI